MATGAQLTAAPGNASDTADSAVGASTVPDGVQPGPLVVNTEMVTLPVPVPPMLVAVVVHVYTIPGINVTVCGLVNPTVGGATTTVGAPGAVHEIEYVVPASPLSPNVNDACVESTRVAVMTGFGTWKNWTLTP